MKANFLKWQVCVLAYLMPHNHGRVLERTYIAPRGDCVTPPGLSFKQCMDELLLFTALGRAAPLHCAVCADDPLRHQLALQKNICLDDVMASFLSTDQDASITATLESANAVTAMRCFILGHVAKDCPHADALLLNALTIPLMGVHCYTRRKRH